MYISSFANLQNKSSKWILKKKSFAGSGVRTCDPWHMSLPLSLPTASSLMKKIEKNMYLKYIVIILMLIKGT